MMQVFHLKTSLRLFVLACILSKYSDAQPSLGSDKKLSPEDLLPFQSCNVDSDCVPAINGLCDCANGGDEVAINKNLTKDFEALFSKFARCTKMGRSVPCGIGAGTICQDSICVFQECTDFKNASRCELSDVSDSNETSHEDAVEDWKDCMIEACKIPTDSTKDNDLEETAISEDLLNQELPSGLMENGKFTIEEMRQFQSCVSDDDCAYVNNGFCDCANGGEEQAVRIDKVDDFNSIFTSTARPCTKMAREIPCGVGAGVKCGSKNYCEFLKCRNFEAALQCFSDADKQDVIQCMEEACANGFIDVEGDGEEADSNGRRPGLLGGRLVNLFGNKRPRNPP